MSKQPLDTGTGKRWIVRTRRWHFLWFAIEWGKFRELAIMHPTYQYRFLFYWPQKLSENIEPKHFGYKSKLLQDGLGDWL